MISSSPKNNQYSHRNILRYEKIFGQGFVSTGGEDVVRWILDQANLPSKSNVLDIGSGLGGAAFYLAENHQATITGVDRSPDQ